MLTHKTFHRYTVRAKRGTAQGLRDARGAAAHSAGASLRRYNEAALYKVSYVPRSGVSLIPTSLLLID